MSKLLNFLVVLTLSAGTALAQALPWDQKPPNSDQETAARESLHEVLRNDSNLHDVYLRIALIGNEESVPLLLQRLRLDYGSAERGDPSGFGVGFDCAQLHLVDALRAITNIDQGMYYPRWASWWEANRGFTQHRWVYDGFAAKGLHIAEPVNEQFGVELIDLTGRGPGYLNFNASRLLATASPEEQAKWAGLASKSTQRSSRLGAIQVASLFEIEGRDALLRALAADPDLEIRRWALTRLNDSLRASLSSAPSNARRLRDAHKDNWIRGLSFINDLLVAVLRDGEILAFDTRTHQKVWTSKVFPGAGDQTLVVGNKLYLAAQEGGVIALDQRGNVLWRSAVGDENNEIRRLISRQDEILVVRLSSIDRLDPNTGAVKATTSSDVLITDADSTNASVFVADRRGLHSLANQAEPEHQFSQALGISVNEQSVCVITSAADDRITCLAPDTLSAQWTQRIGRNGTWGHNIAPIQNGSQVLVPTDTELTAFDGSDGSIIWTAYGGQEYGTTVPTEFGLLVQNMTYQLELRDLQTGEVRRVWPQIRGVAHVAVYRKFAAAADLDGGLWLVDLDK